MLDDALHVEIRRLFFAEHWKVGTIAAELGVHHESVRRAIGRDGFVKRGRVVPSALDAYVPFLRETLEKHPRLRATRLLQMLSGRGYKGSACQLRRRIRQLGLRPSRGEAFLRLTMAAGEQAQVDWAHIGKLAVGDHLRPVYAFVMVLAWSRAAYVDFSFDMTAAAVARGHVRAFDHFGGVPRHCLYDNMKTVVIERMGDVMRLHPRLLELAAHYHFAPRVCRPRRGNEKGRVERAIRYLRESFLAARSFTDLDDLRTQYADWSATVASARPCPQDTRKTVRQALEEERPRLLPRPDHPLHATDTRPVCAHKQPYISVDTNLYSVPHDVVGKPITLVLTDTTVAFVDGDTPLVTHERSWDKRRVIEAPGHVDALKAAKKAARHYVGRERLIAEIPGIERLYEALVARGDPMAPETRALTLLLDRYGASDLTDAITTALQRGTPRASSVEQVLAGEQRTQAWPEPRPLLLPSSRPELAAMHVQNHRLEDYDDLAR